MQLSRGEEISSAPKETTAHSELVERGEAGSHQPGSHERQGCDDDIPLDPATVWSLEEYAHLAGKRRKVVGGHHAASLTKQTSA